MYAPQEAEVEPPTGNDESEGEEPPRPPTPTAQQLPVYDGMEWQQGHALPFPVYYYAPYHETYVIPALNLYAYPLPFGDPYSGLYYEFLYANHHAFTSTGFYTQFAHLFPYVYALPFGVPYAASDPFAHPYFHAFPSVDPYALPQAPLYPGFHDNPYDVLYGHYDHFENMDDEDEEEEAGVEIPYFNATELVSSVENVGPLPVENSSEEFSFSCFFSSFPEASEYPSTSGISSSTRRISEESSDEEAAKRPRWSPESDSD